MEPFPAETDGPASGRNDGPASVLDRPASGQRDELPLEPLAETDGPAAGAPEAVLEVNLVSEKLTCPS